jgi:hypothetical protein
MTTADSKHTALKQSVIHEGKELFWLSAYLILFLCVLSTYRMLLLNEFHLAYFRFGAAVVEALVVAKVILIGEYARLGKRVEDKPVIVSAVSKAFLFTLLLAAFHVVEETLKAVFHGRGLAGTFHELGVGEPLARSLIAFFVFIPLFIAIELRRVLDLDFGVLLRRPQQTTPPSSDTHKVA